MSSEKIIMYDSDEAATFKTGISGWVSGDGRFFGKDEDMARYAGCTHKTCACGNIHSKSWTICDECRDRKSAGRYESMPHKEWEGEPLVIFGDDRYFWDVESVYDHMLDAGTTDLQLVICEPNYAPEINEDHGEEYYPEDQYLDDVAPELAKRIAELNEWIAKEKPILSWSGGTHRTTITPPDSLIAEIADLTPSDIASGEIG